MVHVRWLYDELGDDGFVLSRAYTDLRCAGSTATRWKHLLARCGSPSRRSTAISRAAFVAGGEKVWVARMA